MSEILVFSHHKWPVRGWPNPARLFEWIQSSLPRVAQLVTARQVITFYFLENTSIWGNTTQAPTLPTVISEQHLHKLGPKYMLIIIK